jgi:hypothetical protein
MGAAWAARWLIPSEGGLMSKIGGVSTPPERPTLLQAGADDDLRAPDDGPPRRGRRASTGFSKTPSSIPPGTWGRGDAPGTARAAWDTSAKKSTCSASR